MLDRISMAAFAELLPLRFNDGTLDDVVNEEILKLVADIHAEDYLTLGYLQQAPHGSPATRNSDDTL